MTTPTKRWLKALGAATLTFGAADALWIGGVAKKIYDSNIPHLMADKINVAPAGVFYAAYLAGTVYLIVQPNNTERTWKDAARDGAVLGGLTYGTFGFTNAAVLDGFPTAVAASDAAWGTFLTALTAGVAKKVVSK